MLWTCRLISHLLVHILWHPEMGMKHIVACLARLGHAGNGSGIVLGEELPIDFALHLGQHLGPVKDVVYPALLAERDTHSATVPLGHGKMTMGKRRAH